MPRNAERIVIDHVLVDVLYQREPKQIAPDQVRYLVTGNGVMLGTVFYDKGDWGRPWWSVETKLPLSADQHKMLDYCFFRRYDATRTMIIRLFDMLPSLKQTVQQGVPA